MTGSHLHECVMLLPYRWDSRHSTERRDSPGGSALHLLFRPDFLKRTHQFRPSRSHCHPSRDAQHSGSMSSIAFDLAT